jgi:hypothetical protein
MDATRAQLSPPLHSLRRLLELWKSIKGNMQRLSPSVWRLLRIIITRVMNSICGRLSLLWSKSQPIQLHFNTGSYTAQTVPPPLPPITTDNKLEAAPARSTADTACSPPFGDPSPYSAEPREDLDHLTLDESVRTADRVVQDGNIGSSGNVAQHHREIVSPDQDHLSDICICMFPKDIASRKSRPFYMYVIANLAV